MVHRSAASRFSSWTQRYGLERWWVALLLVVATLTLFALYKTCLGLENQVHVRYFSQLAWGFLHGRLDVVGAHLTDGDLTPYQGKVYAYWPPLPTVLMMPIVAITGPDQFPQRLFAILFASLNTGLFFLVIDRFLRQIGRPLSLPSTIWMALVFAWGSSNFIFGLVANTWFVGQLTASTFVLLALWLAMERTPERRELSTWFAGACFALATAGRQHLLLSLPFWIYLAVSDDRYELPGSGRLLARVSRALEWSLHRRQIVAMIAPLVVVQLVLLGYNAARFGSWFDNGLRNQNFYPRFLADFNRHHYFDLHFIPQDIYLLLLRLPGFNHWDHRELEDGFSLFAQCPILLLTLGAASTVKKGLLTGMLWLAVACCSLPMFMMVNPGATQFGARYLYDVLPFLMLIVLLKSPAHPPAVWKTLGALSIVINILGPLFFLGVIHL